MKNSEKLHSLQNLQKIVFEIDWNIWNRLQNNVLSGGETEACFVYFTDGKSLHFTWQSSDRCFSYKQVI